MAEDTNSHLYNENTILQGTAELITQSSKNGCESVDLQQEKLK